MASSQIIEVADRAARNWSYASPRCIRRGDDEHRTMFARIPTTVPRLVRFARRFMRTPRSSVAS